MLLFLNPGANRCYFLLNPPLIENLPLKFPFNLIPIKISYSGKSILLAQNVFVALRNRNFVALCIVKQSQNKRSICNSGRLVIRSQTIYRCNGHIFSPLRKKQNKHKRVFTFFISTRSEKLAARTSVSLNLENTHGTWKYFQKEMDSTYHHLPQTRLQFAYRVSLHLEFRNESEIGVGEIEAGPTLTHKLMLLHGSEWTERKSCIKLESTLLMSGFTDLFPKRIMPGKCRLPKRNKLGTWRP